MRTIFNSAELNEQYLKNGFIVIKNFLSSNELQNITTPDFSKLQIADRKNYSSQDIKDGALRKKIQHLIKTVFREKTDTLLSNYQPLISTYFLKNKSAESTFNLHQNPTFVDESLFNSIVCWVPLQQVDENSGSLFLVPGTHNLFRTYRTANFVNDEINTQINHVFNDNFRIPIPMEPGDAILFDDALFHGSYSNSKYDLRVSAVQVLIPQEAELLQCEYDSDFVNIYAAPLNYWEDYWDYDYTHWKNILKLKTRVQYKNPDLSLLNPEKINRLLQHSANVKNQANNSYSDNR